MSSVTINSHVSSALASKVPYAFTPEPLEINKKCDLEGKESFCNYSAPQNPWKKIKCR